MLHSLTAIFFIVVFYFEFFCAFLKMDTAEFCSTTLGPQHPPVLPSVVRERAARESVGIPVRLRRSIVGRSGERWCRVVVVQTLHVLHILQSYHRSFVSARYENSSASQSGSFD